MNHKIDYIITYLDPTDPYWLEQFKPYCEDQMKLQPQRYDTDGKLHLKYHFRGIAKYMPWLNNVHLVVFSESQVPEWVNRDTVKVITHDMFIPEKYRPNFNSSTNYMHIHLIPGLEEHFLMSDDDYFSINPTREEDWFTEDGHPRTVTDWKPWHLGKPSPNERDVWPDIFFNSCRFAKVITNTWNEGERNCILCQYPTLHIPQALNKSDMTQWHDEHLDEIENSITPCRSKKNLTGFGWSFATSIKYKEHVNVKFIERQHFNANQNQSIIAEHNKGTHIFNLNFNGRGDFYKNEFEQLFPEKCKYEI